MQLAAPRARRVRRVLPLGSLRQAPVLLALPARAFRGDVIFLAPKQNQGVATCPVSISLETRNHALRAGLTASATIRVDEKKDVLVVPNRTVRRRGREQVVEVVGR